MIRIKFDIASEDGASRRKIEYNLAQEEERRVVRALAQNTVDYFQSECAECQSRKCSDSKVDKKSRTIRWAEALMLEAIGGVS